MSAVRKVFVDAFLGDRRGFEMQVPRVPLGEFYGERLERWLREHGVAVRLEFPIKQIVGDTAGVMEIELASGERLAVDAVILAVPWRRVCELPCEALRGALPELKNMEQFESAPITAVHLWFDGAITDLPHAVLPGRLSQWVFNHGVQDLAGEAEEHAVRGHYYQVVISASRELNDQSREETIEKVRQELAAVWPAVNRTKLIKARLITQQHAVFSPLPGIEPIAAGAKDQRAEFVFGRRLDRDGMAGDDGRRGAERVSCSRATVIKRWPSGENFDAGFTTAVAGAWTIGV